MSVLRLAFLSAFAAFRYFQYLVCHHFPAPGEAKIKMDFFARPGTWLHVAPWWHHENDFERVLRLGSSM